LGVVVDRCRCFLVAIVIVVVPVVAYINRKLAAL